MISAIVAMDANRVIGKNNQLPWHLPADLKHFKAITMGKPIVMGRKTYESIGRPLPGRLNVIVTRDRHLQAPDCLIVHSLKEAIDRLADHEEIVIIGGAELFQHALAFIKRLYLTEIHHPFEGDTVFPELNLKEWHTISREEHAPDEKNLYAYSFSVLEKIVNS